MSTSSPRCVGALEAVQEAGAKFLPQFGLGQLEPARQRPPRGAVERQPTDGPQDVQVDVSEQELAPGVQHGDAARVHLEERPGAHHVQQRLRRGGEEQVIDQPPVVDGQLGERLGQRKHQVGIVDRQDLGQAVFVPAVPPVAAAARAVPVPTGIPVVLGVPACRAVCGVSAQDRRAADFDLAQRAVLLRRQAPTAGPPIARGITPEDVGEREVRRTGPGGQRLRVCAARSRQSVVMAAPGTPRTSAGGRETCGAQLTRAGGSAGVPRVHVWPAAMRTHAGSASYRVWRPSVRRIFFPGVLDSAGSLSHSWSERPALRSPTGRRPAARRAWASAPSGSSRSRELRNEPELGRRQPAQGRWSPESASHEKKHPWNRGPLPVRTEVTRTGAARMIPPTPTPTPNDEQLTYTFDDRHWRVRGLEKQLSCERCA